MVVEGIDAGSRRAASPRRWCSPRTRRCRPATTASRRALIEEHLGPLRDAIGHQLDQLWPGPGRSRTTTDEDFCMTVLALKLSRRANAVSSLHGEVSRTMWTGLWPGRRGRSSADRPHHQRRARADLARAADAPGLSTATWGPTGRSSGDPGFWEGDRERSTTASCGKRTRRSRPGCSTSSAAARRCRPNGAANRRSHRPLAAGAQPRRADDRLRPALCHLQAGQPAVAGPRAAGGAGQRPAAADPVVFAGKAHPHDRPGKQVMQQIAAPDARPAVRRQARLRRGLRHQRRPPPGAGRRRLAQQSAPPARGLGHQRREGRAQRRPEPVGARRLVGRSLRRPERLRHRHGRDPHARPTSTIERDARSAAARAQETKSFRCITTATSDGLPRGWIARMKRGIRTLGWRFSADRMVKDYVLQVLHSRPPAARAATSADCRGDIYGIVTSIHPRAIIVVGSRASSPTVARNPRLFAPRASRLWLAPCRARTLFIPRWA